MQFADPNGDGRVTLDEYTVFQGQAWGYIAQGAEKVKVADLPDMMKPIVAGVAPDRDGFVAHEAFTAYIPARFKAADTDGDGTLTAAELKASLGMAAS